MSNPWGFPEATFDQVFTSCTFLLGAQSGCRACGSCGACCVRAASCACSSTPAAAGFPFNVMMHVMTPITRLGGPEMNRDTVGNVQKAGFELRSVRNLYLDILRVIVASAPQG